MSEAAADTTPVSRPRGRPVGDKPALTAAERQRAYRQRLKQAPVKAQGQVRPLGRVALVKMLNDDLAILDAGVPVEDIDRAQWNVGRILRELATRYRIDVAGNL